MIVLNPGEKIIAKETDYSSGSIGWFGGGVNDAYDIYLVEETSGNLILVLFMKIQFIFHDTKNYSWTPAEKNKFASDFSTAVNGVWGNNRLLKTLTSGKQIHMDVRFESLIDGWSITEHWEIHATKIKKGGFSQSFVRPLTGSVSLDSEDVNFVSKGHGMSQRGVVHEFGHMLGLPDEYKVGTPHASQYHSIMNRGESVLNRHDSAYIQWLDEVLKEKNIQ